MPNDTRQLYFHSLFHSLFSKLSQKLPFTQHTARLQADAGSLRTVSTASRRWLCPHGACWAPAIFSKCKDALVNHTPWALAEGLSLTAPEHSLPWSWGPMPTLQKLRWEAVGLGALTPPQVGRGLASQPWGHLDMGRKAASSQTILQLANIQFLHLIPTDLLMSFITR